MYTITYTVRDAAGNFTITTRTVRVANAPDCSFTITPNSSIGGRVNLQYANPGGGALSLVMEIWKWRWSNWYY